jgi:hypothetical protein
MTIDGSEYIDSKANFEYKNLKFERRPMWIVELQLSISKLAYAYS